MEYTVKQYIKELEKRKKEIDDVNNIALAATTTHAEMTERIFDKGLNCRNAPHGNYSTDPMYINTSKNSPKVLTPKGKTGKTTFASGKSHKTTYFGSGYKEFKSKIGRGDKVNFRLFNDLQLDFANSLQKRGKQYIAGVKRDINSKKIEGLVERFGVCSFRFTEKEKELYLNILGKRLNKIMSGNA